MKKDESDRKRKSLEISSQDYKWIRIGLGVVIAVWLILGLLPLFIAEDSGKVGDTFGMVNALFSGLAFLGVIIAIWLQNREFQNQLLEFSEQTRLQQLHLDQQTEANRAQIEVATQQISLLREERETRARESEIAASPLFTCVFESIDRNAARFRLYNGGGPIFGLSLLSHEASFLITNSAGSPAEYSDVCPFLMRGEFIKIHVGNVGIGTPMHGGSIEFQFVRGDRAKESYSIAWGPVIGLSKERFPSIEIFKVEIQKADE